MMEAFSEFMTSHQNYAHWLIFGSILLAGFNIPISIDVVMICSALLASRIIPENAYVLFGVTLAGCIVAAWIAFWLGRLLGPKITKLPLLRVAVTPERIEKSKDFYQKYGMLTFIVGRFIPFGVRNCMFMSSGLSGMSFKKFCLFDGIACTIWATTVFTLFYFACANCDSLLGHVKTFNIAIFSVFALAVISLVWYKKRKKASK